MIQVYAPTSNAEEAEVEWFYEDLRDLLELTPKKDVLFIIGDWNAKVGDFLSFNIFSTKFWIPAMIPFIPKLTFYVLCVSLYILRKSCFMDEISYLTEVWTLYFSFHFCKLLCFFCFLRVHFVFVYFCPYLYSRSATCSLTLWERIAKTHTAGGGGDVNVLVKCWY